MAKQTIQIADKPTVDEILALLESAEVGLAALKSEVGKGADATTLTAVKTLLENGTYGLNALDKDLTTIVDYLANTTYGLNALKTAINTVNSTLGNGTYGLNALKTSLSKVEDNNSYENFVRERNGGFYTKGFLPSMPELSVSLRVGYELDDLDFDYSFFVLNGVLYMGSSSFSSNSVICSGIFKYDATTYKWTQVLRNPFANQGKVAYVVIGSYAYLLLNTSSSATSKLYRFNGSSLTELASPPLGVLGIYGSLTRNCVAYNGLIYIICESKVFTYNPSTNSYTEIGTPPNTGSSNGRGVVVWNSKIYLVGCSDSSYNKKFYKGNGVTWTALTDLPVPVYIAGGLFVDSNNYLNIIVGEDHLVYKSDTSWEYKYGIHTLPRGSTVKNHSQYVYFNKEIHGFGGNLTTLNFLGSGYAYSHFVVLT